MNQQRTFQRISRVTLLGLAMAFCVVLQATPLAAAATVVGENSTLPMPEKTSSTTGRQSDSQDRIQVMIELEMAPAAQIYAAQAVSASGVDQVAAATRAHLASVEATQQAVLTTLAQIDAHVIYRVQRIYNGIAVDVAPDQIDTILSTPGVAAVHTLTPISPDHTRSVPFINAPAIWNGAAGFPVDGAGTTIAVIDTGIDYLHANFGGSRRYSDNDPTIIGDVPDFPGLKVVAGYDFAGDEYDANPDNSTYNPFRSPDPDPMDCYGHGTHVAGTAAGTGVTPENTPVSYGGPFDETTFNQVFSIGPGVAPGATLIALKIFGCQGSSNLTALAIEWAVDPNQDGDFSDHVDVINMSLGSPYGTIYDPTVIASDNAALIGVVVVASAGNMGDTYYVTGAPAVSDRAISVAAARDHLFTDEELANTLAASEGPESGNEGQSLATSFTSRGPRLGDAALKPDIAAPGEGILSSRAGSPGTGARQLSGTSMAAPHVAGAMALLRQIHPDWRVEELKALVMNTAHLQADTQANPFSPTRTGSGTIELTNALNTDVIAFNADDPGQIGISFGMPEVIDRTTGVKNLRLRNRGESPAGYVLTYHSVIDTPGADIAFDFDSVTVPANDYANVPVIMRATADDLRHTRAPNVSDLQSLPRHWLSEESGYVMLWPEEGAFRADLTTEGSGDPLSDSYADFTYDPQSARLDYTIHLADFAPDQIETIQVRRGLTGNSGTLVHDVDIPAEWTDAATPITGTLTLDRPDEPLLVSSALHLSVTTSKTDALSLRGQLMPTPAVLHVPVFVAPKPAADMRAAESTLIFSTGEEALQTVQLVGQDLIAQDPPVDYGSLVSVFELGHSSLREVIIGIEDGRAAANAFADLQYVGLTDNRTWSTDGNVDESKVYFGIATYGDWSTPNQVEFNIYIDADEDGIHDYRVFNSDARGYRSNNRASDAFVTVVENLETETFSKLQLLNQYSSLTIDTNLFNTNVMMLPIDASDIGLSNANTDFAYRIQSINKSTGFFVDTTPPLYYDLATKVIDLSPPDTSAPMFDDHDGAEIGLRFNTDHLSSTGGSPNLLLLHHQNGQGNRAEVVETRFDWPVDVYLPRVSAQE